MLAKVVIGAVLAVALAGGSAEAAKGKQRRLPGMRAFTAFLAKRGRTQRPAVKSEQVRRPVVTPVELAVGDIVGMHTTAESTRPEHALNVVAVHFRTASGAVVPRSVREIIRSGNRDLIDIAQMSVNSAIEDLVSRKVFGAAAGLELKIDNLRIAYGELDRALGR